MHNQEGVSKESEQRVAGDRRKRSRRRRTAIKGSTFEACLTEQEEESRQVRSEEELRIIHSFYEETHLAGGKGVRRSKKEEDDSGRGVGEMRSHG